jgi:phosphoribosylformimino-5-aminoimidazole carboxamide ribotide isomerase
VPVVASGGVSSLDDLRALARLPLAGVIVGTAIYERRFSVEEGVAACSPSA